MIRRHIDEPLRRALGDTPVVLLNGARQTGKTTLAQAIGQRSGATYFTLDDAATLALATADPTGFIRNLSGPVVLDEIQQAPDLFPAIKLAVDQHRVAGRFLLTASANVMIPPRLSESLAGRMEIVPIGRPGASIRRSTLARALAVLVAAMTPLHRPAGRGRDKAGCRPPRDAVNAVAPEAARCCQETRRTM
ncbi:MAG: AAA family ATPase [Verrucomicrobiae bacterium]|nr:AAA family ATPase [Verrucomicrobiae bacterium]